MTAADSKKLREQTIKIFESFFYNQIFDRPIDEDYLDMAINELEQLYIPRTQTISKSEIESAKVMDKMAKPTVPGDGELRQKVKDAFRRCRTRALWDIGVRLDHISEAESDVMQIVNELASQSAAAQERLGKAMAMCTDDRTFLEMHKHANVIECDEKLKRPSRAIYHNRQWEAERQGLDVLAFLAAQLKEPTTKEIEQ